MTCPSTRSRNISHPLTCRLTSRVSTYCPNSPLYPPFALIFASDILCVSLIHIKVKGCGGTRRKP